METKWIITPEGLMREFEFSTHVSLMQFLLAISEIAEQLNHHPNICYGFKKAKIQLITFSKQQITPLDFQLAEKIDLLWISSC